MSRRKQASAGFRGRGTRLPPGEQLTERADGNWWVRRVTGASSAKTYTCPGCNGPIPPATPHLVVWPEQKALLSDDAIDERRHWHTPCWDRGL